MGYLVQVVAFISLLALVMYNKVRIKKGPWGRAKMGMSYSLA